MFQGILQINNKNNLVFIYEVKQNNALSMSPHSYKFPIIILFDTSYTILNNTLFQEAKSAPVYCFGAIINHDFTIIYYAGLYNV